MFVQFYIQPDSLYVNVVIQLLPPGWMQSASAQDWKNLTGLVRLYQLEVSTVSICRARDLGGRKLYR